MRDRLIQILMWQDRAADAELVLLEQRDKVARIFGSGSLEVGRLELEIANFLIKLGRGRMKRGHMPDARPKYSPHRRARRSRYPPRFLLAKTEKIRSRPLGQAAQKQKNYGSLKANLLDDHPMVLVASVDLSWMLHSLN